MCQYCEIVGKTLEHLRDHCPHAGEVIDLLMGVGEPYDPGKVLRTIMEMTADQRSEIALIGVRLEDAGWRLKALSAVMKGQMGDSDAAYITSRVNEYILASRTIDVDTAQVLSDLVQDVVRRPPIDPTLN